MSTKCEKVEFFGKKKIKFDPVEFKVFIIRYYGTLKNFAEKHGLAYSTCKQMMIGNVTATNVVKRIKEIMHEENEYDTEPRKKSCNV